VLTAVQFHAVDVIAARWLCDVLARMPGIHITVAVAWQRASAGDWAACAAEISRRKGTGNDTPA
jgi:hypothetical protein